MGLGHATVPTLPVDGLSEAELRLYAVAENHQSGIYELGKITRKTEP